MRKAFKIGFPIACVVIIGGTFVMLHNMKKDVENANVSSNIIANQENNTILDNVTNNEETKNVTSDISIPVAVEDEEQAKTDKKKNQNKAIELVKEKYGNSSNVYFSNEGNDEENENKYIVAVRNKETTTAKIYYIVDINTDEVEIYY